MLTVEEFKAYFVTARRFVKVGNEANKPIVISSVKALSDHFKEMYKTANAINRAKCRVQYENMDRIISIMEAEGFANRAVLAFFGLAPSAPDAPSYDDIASGKYDGGVLGGGVRDADGNGMSGCGGRDANSGGVVERGNPDLVQPASGQSAGRVAPISPAPVNGADKPVYTPESLGDFIGQTAIVRDLRKEIAIAKASGMKHLDNILLFGNPGLGKTTLMELIAKELGVKFELLDCSQFRNSQQSLKALQNFLKRVGDQNEPVVIAFDEIHMLNETLQSSLLTLLNNREYVSPPDINGVIKRIAIPEFTFIGATTNDEGVIGTIKNRCLRLTYQMVDYTPEELRRIYRNKIASKGLTIDDNALETCIPRSRGAIRYVNSIVDGLDRALYNDIGERLSKHIDLYTALAYFKAKGIDTMGLTPKDLEILNALKDCPGDFMGADVLAARVGLETNKYLSEYEKYLIKIGFITVSGKGRSLTASGLKHLVGDGDANGTPPIPTEPVNGGQNPVAPQEPIDIIDGLYNGRKDS